MSTDDVQTEILQRLTRVETKLDMQLNAKDIAAEALEKAKSAHLRQNDFKARLDEIEKQYDNEIRLLNARVDAESATLIARIQAENQERKLDRRWMIGTMFTACALIVATIKLF
ncbi:MAG: hypothetical protein P0Y55_12000 [Candidatus Cohnella colombiensis]|uniref:Uncharacterized protein n=1 Tax=Candidatus Cohnella colombiensis TaxID=3121368 RepID=A0AA95F423_9BACL|nr:MAG: hypothetical protein P0Y55_12000 [Cohnella sp.]